MKDKIISFLEFGLGVLLLLFFQNYALKVISNFGIDLSGYSSTIINLVIFGIQILLCVILYFIYKGSIKTNRSGFKNHLLKNLLYAVLVLAVMTVVMNICIYFIKYIANMFGIMIVNAEIFNVMQNDISLNYIIGLVKTAFIIPFSYCVVYILGVEKLFRKKGTTIIMSGLIWAIVEAFNYGPNLLNMIFNALPTFILGVFLAYIYSRNKNIWYPIIVLSLYLLFSPLLISYLRW